MAHGDFNSHVNYHSADRRALKPEVFDTLFAGVVLGRHTFIYAHATSSSDEHRGDEGLRLGAEG